MRSLVWIAVLGGCGKGPPDCVSGFEPGPRDLCYEVGQDPPTTTVSVDSGTIDSGTTTEPVTIGDLLAELPVCVPLVDDPTGALDLVAGCAGAACVGQTYAELVGSFGGDADCTPFTDDPTTLVCVWDLWDVMAYLDDVDLDGVPDPGFASYALWVGPAFPGATTDGLGAGISVGCFVDSMGPPSYFQTEQSGGEYWLSWYGWNSGDLYVEDRDDAFGNLGGDGVVDWVYLSPD